MLAQGEAFAVKDGVPAKAAAHAVHFAVQIPAAVRAGIEQFILAAVGFEICHADASEPHRYAAREQFAEHFFGSGEQFPLVIGWFDQTHRLVRRKMVDVTEAQAEGARLLAVFAQGRADALAEILDQAAEKFRVNGAASMVVSRETDFGVEGSSTSRPSRPRARSQICWPMASPKAACSAAFGTPRSCPMVAMPRSASAPACTWPMPWSFSTGRGVRKVSSSPGEIGRA